MLSSTLYSSCNFFFFLVEHCKGVNEVSHVYSIVRKHGPQSSLYMVICNADTACDMERGIMNATRDNGLHKSVVKLKKV